MDTQADTLGQLPAADEKVEITVTIPKSHLRSFNRMLTEYWYSGLFKEAEATRAADREGWIESLRELFRLAEHSDTGQARVCAAFLAGLYNGPRFPFDLTDLRLLDVHLFAHALNVLRLDNVPEKEVHLYFDNGGDRFEAMIRAWRLEKKRRRG